MVKIFGTLSSGREITDGWDDDGWDIDRWENDGGRSLDTGHGSVCDWKSYGGLGF